MQLRMGTQIRNRQRQARMDTGTRSTVLDRGSHPYTGGARSICRSRLEAEKSLSWLCSWTTTPTAVYRRLWWQQWLWGVLRTLVYHNIGELMNHSDPWDVLKPQKDPSIPWEWGGFQPLRYIRRPLVVGSQGDEIRVL